MQTIIPVVIVLLLVLLCGEPDMVTLCQFVFPRWLLIVHWAVWFERTVVPILCWMLAHPLPCPVAVQWPSLCCSTWIFRCSALNSDSSLSSAISLNDSDSFWSTDYMARLKVLDSACLCFLKFHTFLAFTARQFSIRVHIGSTITMLPSMLSFDLQMINFHPAFCFVTERWQLFWSGCYWEYLYKCMYLHSHVFVHVLPNRLPPPVYHTVVFSSIRLYM